MSGDVRSPRLSEVLAELGQGKVEEIGSDILREVVTAVATYPGTKGKVTITIDVAEKEGAIFMDASFRTRRPHEPIPATRVWVDNGQLSLFDPDPKVVTFPPPRGGGGRGRGPAS